MTRVSTDSLSSLTESGLTAGMYSIFISDNNRTCLFLLGKGVKGGISCYVKGFYLGSYTKCFKSLSRLERLLNSMSLAVPPKDPSSVPAPTRQHIAICNFSSRVRFNTQTVGKTPIYVIFLKYIDLSVLKPLKYICRYSVFGMTPCYLQ